MNAFPLRHPKVFFQPFAQLNALDMSAGFDQRPNPIYDEYGYVPSNTGGKLGAQSWSRRDYGEPNIVDLTLTIGWHGSEAEAHDYYSMVVKRTLPIVKPFGGIEMPGSDELLARAFKIPGSDNILQIVVRYGNYVFNLTVLAKPDGYFPTIEAFADYAKAFDQNTIKVLSKK